MTDHLLAATQFLIEKQAQLEQELQSVRQDIWTSMHTYKATRQAQLEQELQSVRQDIWTSMHTYKATRQAHLVNSGTVASLLKTHLEPTLVSMLVDIESAMLKGQTELDSLGQEIHYEIQTEIFNEFFPSYDFTVDSESVSWKPIKRTKLKE